LTQEISGRAQCKVGGERKKVGEREAPTPNAELMRTSANKKKSPALGGVLLGCFQGKRGYEKGDQDSQTVGGTHPIKRGPWQFFNLWQNEKKGGG